MTKEICAILQEAEEELAKLRQEELDKQNAELAPKKQEKRHEERKVFSSGVGKYINPAVKKDARKDAPTAAAASSSSDGFAAPQPPRKKAKATGQFGDFSSW